MSSIRRAAFSGISTTVNGGSTTSYTATTPLTDGVAYEWQVSGVFDISDDYVDGPTTVLAPFAVESPGIVTLVTPQAGALSLPRIRHSLGLPSRRGGLFL